VPSLYAATTFDAAVYETIAHGADLRDPFRHVRREALDDRCHSEVVCAGELLLAPLFRPEVEALGHAHEALFAPRVSAYADCLALAARLHAELPRAQGSIWSSVRDDGRVLRTALRLSRRGRSDPARRDATSDGCTRAG
jgi:hypothetical protein